jgi:hypothetical protein
MIFYLLREAAAAIIMSEDDALRQPPGRNLLMIEAKNAEKRSFSLSENCKFSEIFQFLVSVPARQGCLPCFKGYLPRFR